MRSKADCSAADFGGKAVKKSTMIALAPDEIFRLTQELGRAREELERYRKFLLEVRRSILPPELPGVPGLDLAVHFADADGAGGDFYDVRPVGPNHWAIVVADVIGHGLAAAAILALVHALGNAVQNQQVPLAPGEALALINKLLATRYLANTGKFVTAFVGLYDTQERVMTYSSAGHPPPRLVRGNEVCRLDAAAGLPLGIETTSAYGSETVKLLAGDRLIAFTDGITESANAAHELFGDEKLDEIVCTPASGAAELVSRIVAAVQTFRAGCPAIDDETCLVATVQPAQEFIQVQRK